jgi:hypothetical protein
MSGSWGFDSDYFASVDEFSEYSFLSNIRYSNACTKDGFSFI